MRKLIIFFIFISCGDNCHSQSVISVVFTHINKQPSAYHASGVSYCKKRWDSVMPVPLRIKRTKPIHMRKVDPSGEKLLWRVYKRYPFKGNGKILVAFAPHSANNKTATVYGYATSGSYKHTDKSFKPLVLVYTFPELTTEAMGELICHEIAHTMGYHHKYGAWDSPRSIKAITRFLKRL